MKKSFTVGNLSLITLYKIEDLFICISVCCEGLNHHMRYFYCAFQSLSPFLQKIDLINRFTKKKLAGNYYKNTTHTLTMDFVI